MPDLPSSRRPIVPPAPRHRSARWIVPLIALVVTAILLRAYGSTTLTAYRLRREAARLERQVQTLRRENAQLREEIRRLHTPAYIERLAREQLGLVKPGEIPVILLRPTPSPKPAP
jgi:cell division protein FtsL